MSKLISRFLAAFLAVSMAGMGLAISRPGSSTAQSPAVARRIDQNAAVVEATAEVLKETSTIRGLPVLRSVRSGAQSREQIERMLVSKLNSQVPPQEMHALEQSLKKFGLVPNNFAYRSFIVNLLTEQVAGYYDPSARRFHLADWLDLDAQKPVMAHELTHALQDQHFNLRRFEKWPSGEADAELAAHALVEGDATLTMMYYLANHPSRALAFARSLGADNMASKQFEQAPRALRETLVFPYLQGMEWARIVHQRGGWKMLSQAYTSLPASTEQILHADKYFSHEAPVKISLPDLTTVLNGVSKTPSGKPVAAKSRGRTNANARSSVRNRQSQAWRQIETDVNGEWGYYLILDQFLKDTGESKRASAGWAGDRFSLYERSSSPDLLLVQVTQWDTQEDAEEFFNAYVKRTLLRYPNSQILEAAQRPNSNTVRRWNTNEGGVLVELRGLLVVILEGVPSGVSDVNLASQLGR